MGLSEEQKTTPQRFPAAPRDQKRRARRVQQENRTSKARRQSRHKRLTTKAAAARTKSIVRARKLAKASAATQRSGEQQEQRDFAALEHALLTWVVRSTAVEATQACVRAKSAADSFKFLAGMQDSCDTVELRNQDASFNSVFIHLNNVKSASSVALPNGKRLRVMGREGDAFIVRHNGQRYGVKGWHCRHEAAQFSAQHEATRSSWSTCNAY